MMLFLLLVASVACFGFATVLMNARINLVAAGLFCGALYFLLNSSVIDQLQSK